MSDVTTPTDDLEDSVDNDLLSWLLYSGDSLEIHNLNSSPLSSGANDTKSEGDTDTRIGYEDQLSDGNQTSAKSNSLKKRHREDALEKRLEELQTGTTTSNETED